MSTPIPHAKSFRRAGVVDAPPAVPWPGRWYGKLALVLVGAGLLSLSFAPVNQFYLAWVGLVPWLVVLRHCRSGWRAMGWSWAAGVAFFSANMWWLYYVTGPGLVALMAILGLYWAAAGGVLRGAGFLNDAPPPADAPAWRRAWAGVYPVFGVAAVWVAFEWLRGTWPFRGLAWAYLGHTQTPALVLCQIADAAGELGVSFWVALVNAWGAHFLARRLSVRRMIPATAGVALATAGVVGYGLFRFAQEPAATRPGPTVLVVQPNIPQSNSGEKGAPLEKIISFHRDTTAAALLRRPDVDLAVWSETMMPPINQSARDYFRAADRGDLPELAHQTVRDLAFRFRTALLVGGMYWDDIRERRGGDIWPADSRNSAYYYDRVGVPSGLRYDKIHLVPFGEYIPFKDTLPPLYRLLLSLGPPNMEDYQLTRGDESRLTVFPLAGEGNPAGWRFVTPVCFEDMDGPLVARMFRPDDGGGKRADFIVNLTNDGWFRANEMPQHFQAAQFRSIETRAPTARSVNTGISGFVDSMGRPHDLLGTGTEGTSVARLRLDARVTPFTRHGNIFAGACAAITAVLAGAGMIQWWRSRRVGR